MEESILRIITVYLVGITGIWKSIPVGILLNSHPLEIAILTSLGSITTVFVLYFFGESVKKWVLKKWSSDKLEKKKGKFNMIMDRYGIIGIGIICPGIFGPITCIIVGLFVVKNTSKLMPYLTIGIIIWSFLLTLLATSGFDLVNSWI
jgi:membrane protein YqaA with SNARE-associated domain